MLREPLAKIHAAHGFDVHLRPTSSNGATMIGLSAGRPQRGKGGFTDMERLVRRLRARSSTSTAVPGLARARHSGERASSRRLIRDAYAHSREMTLLTTALRQDERSGGSALHHRRDRAAQRRRRQDGVRHVLRHTSRRRLIPASGDRAEVRAREEDAHRTSRGLRSVSSTSSWQASRL